MDDLISRQDAIYHCKKRLYQTAEVNRPIEVYADIAENRIGEWLNELPSAQPERILYANMSDAEFEKWLYEHGICNPNIHESIPCDAVPLLIDNAISELPSAQPERKNGEWVRGIDPDTHMRDLYDWTCSLCWEKYPWKPNFCPNCGARMEGGSVDDE